MYFIQELNWNVVIPAESLGTKGVMLQKEIIVRLQKKATKDLAYLLVLTTVDNIGEEKSGTYWDVLFKVAFIAMTFKLFSWRNLSGSRAHDAEAGSYLEMWPNQLCLSLYFENARLQLCARENLVFSNDKMSKIEKSVKVHFIVIGFKCHEAEMDFQALVGLHADYLGPVSRSSI